ncbi:hypothetical protein E2C01_055430 [Portunus trituberculatus]|uniref:Uncharacterized protein n=1 Tax=Portunus trituberculatus TaxID=210409 RepID=A0A5B7GMF4_PORTR|nr:hypothetical protein [Portunus trituberculatus]
MEMVCTDPHYGATSDVQLATFAGVSEEGELTKIGVMQRDKIPALQTEKTLLETPLIIFMALENSRDERAESEYVPILAVQHMNHA